MLFDEFEKQKAEFIHRIKLSLSDEVTVREPNPQERPEEDDLLADFLQYYKPIVLEFEIKREDSIFPRVLSQSFEPSVIFGMTDDPEEFGHMMRFKLEQIASVLGKAKYLGKG